MNWPRLAPLAAALLISACVHTIPPDLDALWDHERPAVSEERFRALLSSADALRGDARLAAETQLARSLGLQQRFEEAHALLDGVRDALGDAPAREAERAPSRARVRARYHLERGRALRSGGDAAAARAEFQRALEVADAAQLEFFAADALHMLALVAPLAEQVAAHQAATARIERSTDARARRWLAPLTNNLAWSHHDRGEFAEALATFERAVPLFAARGDANELRIARWSVARAQRSLGRCAEALPAQQVLLAEHAAAGSEDGFVHEEIAECLLGLARGVEARPHFREAHRLLSQDALLVRDEPSRVARLQRLASE